ncbi:MAG: hypothetical protein AAGG68_14365 [Bacteroidota bacterium]
MLLANQMKKKIEDLTNDIIDDLWQDNISKIKIESQGIIDGKQVIFEFLNHNEIGCAYEHLDYMIHEIGIQLSATQISQMNEIGKELNIK